MKPSMHCYVGLLSFLAFLATGCPDPEESVVPYQQGSAAPPAVGSPPANDESEAWQPVRGQNHPPGTHGVPISGADFHPPGQEVRVVLDLQSVGHTSANVLALTRPPNGGASLIFAPRRGEAYPELHTIQEASAPSECTLHGASIRTLSPNVAWVQFGWLCAANPTSNEAPPPAQVNWLVRLEAFPRLGEELTLTETTSWSLNAPNAEPSGNSELISLTLQAVGDRERRIPLQWIERENGLVLGRELLAEAVAAQVTAAQSALTRDPGQAQVAAQESLQVIENLCRGNPAIITLSGVRGLPCDSDEAVDSLNLLRISALLRAGDLADAAKAEERFLRRRSNLPSAQMNQLDEAWEATPEPSDYTWRSLREGHGISPTRHPSPSRLDFISEGELLVNGGETYSILLANGQTTPSEISAGPGFFADPNDSERGIQALVRSCAGFHAQLGYWQQPPGLGTPIPLPDDRRVFPLVEALSGLSPRGCATVPSAAPEQTGGWHILGWQGSSVIAARFDEVVGTASSGRSDVAPRQIAATAEALRSLQSVSQMSQLTRRAYAHSTRRGIYLLHYHPRLESRLLRPPSALSISGELYDIALSPSGKRLAVLSRRHIWLIEASDAEPLPSPANLIPQAPAGI